MRNAIGCILLISFGLSIIPMLCGLLEHGAFIDIYIQWVTIEAKLLLFMCCLFAIPCAIVGIVYLICLLFETKTKN